MLTPAGAHHQEAPLGSEPPQLYNPRLVSPHTSALTQRPPCLLLFGPRPHSKESFHLARPARPSMGPPLPLLLLAAAGVKQLLKRRPHRRRCAGASTAESQRDPCCAATTETSRAMSCAASVESTMVSWSPVPMLLSQLSLLLHTSLTAMGCGWTEFTPVMQAIMQCTWTLRWLLAVQAGAAEAFASDFDLVSLSR